MSLSVLKTSTPAVNPAAFKYWPDAPPKRLQELHRIFQIQYMVPPKIPASNKDSGTVPVFSRNLYVLKTHPHEATARGELWREMPDRYEEPLRRIIYQMDMYIYMTAAIAYNKAPHYSTEYVKNDKEGTETLRDYLKYTDTVMDEIWAEVLVAKRANDVNRDWRSKIFDDWLLKEFYVRKHSPSALIQHGAVSTEIVPEDLDWAKYDDSVPAWHSGTSANWSFGGLPDATKLEIIGQVISWCKGHSVVVDADVAEDDEEETVLQGKGKGKAKPKLARKQKVSSAGGADNSSKKAKNKSKSKATSKRTVKSKSDNDDEDDIKMEEDNGSVKKKRSKAQMLAVEIGPSRSSKKSASEKLIVQVQPLVSSELDVVTPESPKLDIISPEPLRQELGLLGFDDDIIMQNDDVPPEHIQESLNDGNDDGETAKRRKLDVVSEQVAIIAEKLKPVKPLKKSPTPGFRPNTRASSRHQSSTPADLGTSSMDVDWSNIVPPEILLSIPPSQTRASSPKASTSKLDPGL